MSDDLREEARIESAVLDELARQPMYALELASALGEDQRAVAAAVTRLAAAEQIAVPGAGRRFQRTC
jgi:hypothetical protein